jgi:putative sigma-54 modulation protein
MARPEIDESAPAYTVTIIGRHVDVTDGMKQYLQDKISKIERLHGRVLGIVATMDVVRTQQTVDLVMRVDHIKVVVHASTDSMYASIDKAVHRLERQLARYRRRIQEHNAKHLSIVDMDVNVIERPAVDELEDINDAIETRNEAAIRALWGPHEVTKQETLPLKTLSMDEAVMKMDLSGDHFLVYRSEEDHRLKVIYRRTNGSYGIVAPE